MTGKSLNDVRHSFFSVQADMRLRNHFELRMMEENRPDGLLNLSVCDDDGILQLNYDVTGKEPLSEYLLTKKLSAGDIRCIILGLKHVLNGLPSYLLSGNGLVLTAETVYTDPVFLSPFFLYMPGRNEPFSESLTGFLQTLMAATNHDDYESVVLAYRLYKESQENANAIDRLEQILITPGGADLLSGTEELHRVADAAPREYISGSQGAPCIVESADTFLSSPADTGENAAGDPFSDSRKPPGLFGRLFRKNDRHDISPAQAGTPETHAHPPVTNPPPGEIPLTTEEESWAQAIRVSEKAD